MGGACGPYAGPQKKNEFLTFFREKKTIDSIMKMTNFFCLGLFSGERFTGKQLFDTGYKMVISVQNAILKVNNFL